MLAALALYGLEDFKIRLGKTSAVEILECEDILKENCSNANVEGLPVAQMLESACNAGDPGLIPGLRRSLGEGNGNPFQYSCLQNPMDRGAWRVIVHGVIKSRTGLNDYTWCEIKEENMYFMMSL